MTDAALAQRTLSLDDMRALSGQEVGVSDWLIVTQDRIDGFAEVTGDDQFIHVDPVRAAATPLGGTIAHGFLTLSLLPILGRDTVPRIRDRTMAINYGLDRVRFVSPVRSGARVRGRYTLAAVEPRSETEFLLRYQVIVEIEGGTKPALVADWLTLAIMGG
jgi:acyl dehydratase